MKHSLTIILTAVTFSALGLAAAFGIAIYAPTPPGQVPVFERVMFALLPFAGATIGWFIGYLATPFDRKS